MMTAENITLRQACRMNRLGGQLVAAAIHRSPQRREEIMATVDKLYARVGAYLRDTENQ